MSLSIPNWAPLVGYHMAVQATATSTSNAAGFATSNGLGVVLGY